MFLVALLYNLMGSQQHLLTPHEGHDWILVVEDLSPSDTVGLNREALLGFLTDSGENEPRRYHGTLTGAASSGGLTRCDGTDPYRGSSIGGW